MRVETTKKLIFTKAEQKIIAELQELFDNDSSLSYGAVWDIITDISLGSDRVASEYGYNIKIID